MMDTLVVDVDLWRGDLTKRGELRTFLCLEDCADRQIAAWPGNEARAIWTCNSWCKYWLIVP
jgi:hypothetical protein